MKSSAIFALVWAVASPGYKYSFPADYFSHPAYKTEWWYYTGNLHTDDGRRFGFELTFFRAGRDRTEESTPVWRTNEVWLTHLALSDVQGQRFLHTSRLNRSGPGLAGASQEQARYWNGNWQAQWLHPNGAQQLKAVREDFSIELNLQPAKGPVINGRDGISKKGPLPGEASHYISFTRLTTTGSLSYAGKTFHVTGLTWMDHEFFTEQNDANLGGWDWFAIQLENNQELMLYRLRLKDGSASPYSSGTFVDANGQSQCLSASDFTLTPQPRHFGAYPIEWAITVPRLGLSLRETTLLANQELSATSATPAYWEGAVDYVGTEGGQPLRGVGYLEMTGYGGQNHPIF